MPVTGSEKAALERLETWRAGRTPRHESHVLDLDDPDRDGDTSFPRTSATQSWRTGSRSTSSSCSSCSRPSGWWSAAHRSRSRPAKRVSSRIRSSESAAMWTRNPPTGRSPGDQDVRLLQLTVDRDVDHLLRRLVRPVGDRRDHLQGQQVDHHEATVTWLGYVGSADFWKATLENWQSEFLAVGSFVALTVFLRQRGSTQSKPVGAPHHSTGVEG